MRALVLVCLLAGIAHAKPRVTEGRSIVLLVDRALTKDEIEVARLAAKQTTLREDDDHWGVVAFGKTAEVICPLGTRGRRGKQRGAVTSTTDPTSLVAGLEVAHSMLKRSTRSTKLVIVITNASDTTGVEPAIAKLRADDITISAISIAHDNAKALATIATAGKGRKYVTRDSAAVAVAIQREVDRPPPGEETFCHVFLIDRSLVGVPLEWAKEEARTRAEALSPNDMIAVIAFDSAVDVYTRPQRAANRMRISHDISRIKSGTMANTALALQRAGELLSGLVVTEKHIVLIGTGNGADLEHVKALAANGVTVSAAGYYDRNRNQLAAIAKAGNGQLKMVNGIDLRMR